MGCNNFVDAYYFSFLRDNIYCYVGDSVEIFNLETKTNITSYEHMHIYTNNTDVLKVDNNNKIVSLLKEGEATIFVSGSYNNDYITDSIVINISSKSEEQNNQQSNDNLKAKLINNSVYENRIIETYNITFNNIDYVDFRYEVLVGTTNDYEINLYNSIIEINYVYNSSIEVKIIDNKNENNFYILNLN